MYRCISSAIKVRISVDGRSNGPSDSVSHELFAAFACNNSPKKERKKIMYTLRERKFTLYD